MNMLVVNITGMRRPQITRGHLCGYCSEPGHL